MDLNLFFEGSIIGFSIAAAIGPIGVLCIRRSLTNGWKSGLFTGLGAATADAFYGAIAGFGLTLLSNFLLNHTIWIQSIGIVFLVYLGIKTFIEKPEINSKTDSKNQNYLSDYLSTVGLTITNPTTIISFLAIFGGIGISNTSNNYIGATLLVLGVFIGSVLWWLMLSNGINLLRKKTNNNILEWINRISGMIMILFAIALLINISKY